MCGGGGEPTDRRVNGLGVEGGGGLLGGLGGGGRAGRWQIVDGRW